MKKLFLLISLIVSSQLYSQDFSIIAVGEADLEKDKMVVSVPFGTQSLSSADQNIANTVSDIFKNNFSYYKKRFDVTKELSRSMKTSGSLNYDFWKEKKVTYVLRVNINKKATNLEIHSELFNSNQEGIQFEMKFEVNKDNIRKQVHQVSDSMFKAITKKSSIFKSRIFFVSDRNGNKRNPVKELYSMDFDGENIMQHTFHKGTVISPAISSDGSKVLYSLIKSTKSKKRNINLYLLDLTTNKSRLI